MIRITAAAFGSPLWREMVRFRERLLRAPLGLAFDPAELEREQDHQHLALTIDDRLAGTLLIHLSGDNATAKLRQMAIEPERRGDGLGGRLLQAGERHAVAAGTRGGVLHARLAVRGFYERFGWMGEGDIFTEVTLPHVRMTKTLDPV